MQSSPTPHSYSTLNAVHGVRAIASMCVAALHLYAVEMLTANSIMPKAMEFARIGTDLLFVVSGAALVFASKKRSSGGKEAISFMYDRVTRIMPLYWLITAIPLSLWIISKHTLFAHMIQNFDFWSTAFLVPTGAPPADFVAWSLTNLLFFYAIFACIIALPRRFEPIILGLWAALVIALRIAHADVWGSPFVKMVTHWSALEFIFGVVAMRCALAGRIPPPRTTFVLTILWMIFVVFVVYGPTPSAIAFNDENLRLMTLGPAALGIVCTAIGADFIKRAKPNKVLRFLGDISFAIYLTHVVVFAIVGRLWSFAPHQPNHIPVIISMAGSVLLVGWAAHRFAEIPLRKATHQAKPKLAHWLAGVRPSKSIVPQSADQAAEVPK